MRTFILILLIQAILWSEILSKSEICDKISEKCSCEIKGEGIMQMKCPLIDDDVSISIKDETFIEFDCKNKDFDYQEVISQLEVVDIPTLKLSSCQLSTEGFAKTVEKIDFKSLIYKNQRCQENIDSWRGLENLENLQIHCIKIPSDDLFKHLRKLKKLQLILGISSLPSNIFDPLEDLEVLDLTNNRIENLPSRIFKNQRELKSLTLTLNLLKNISRSSFIGAANLENLDLSFNKIRKLEENAFADLPKLKSLDLSKNRIKILPRKIFKASAYLNNSAQINGQLNLLNFDLSSNLIDDLNFEFFDGAERLQILKLSHNKIRSISRLVFHNLIQLTDLHLDHNRIEYIESTAFSTLQNLEVLDLSHNLLNFNEILWINGKPLVNQSPFQNLVKLQVLNLKKNSLVKSLDIRNLKSLRKIDYSWNKITSLSTNDLKFLPTKVTIDYTKNQITTIDLKENFKNSTNVIYLSDNPIFCDCKLQKFIKIAKRNQHLKLNNLRCFKPANLKNKLVSRLNFKDLSCPVEICPERCSCDLRENKSLLVNCTNVGLEEFPILPASSFEEALTIELHVEKNRISKLPQNFSNLKNVVQIYAAENQITELNFNVLPGSLKVLEIHQNWLESLEGSIESLSKLDRLTLGKNPYKCNCDNLQLFNLVKMNSKIISDIVQMTCTDTNLQINSLQNEDFCQSKKIFYILGGCGLALAGILMGIYVYLEVSKEDLPEISEKPSFFVGSTNLRIVLVSKEMK